MIVLALVVVATLGPVRAAPANSDALQVVAAEQDANTTDEKTVDVELSDAATDNKLSEEPGTDGDVDDTRSKRSVACTDIVGANGETETICDEDQDAAASEPDNAQQRYAAGGKGGDGYGSGSYGGGGKGDSSYG